MANPLKPPVNPFHYGREIVHLVDREEEVAAVTRALSEQRTMFLVGPRRFGKTSVLKAAQAQASKAGVMVLRHDAEAYERVDLLGRALLADAVRRFSSTLEKAQSLASKFFGRLRPSLSYDVMEQKVSVALGADAEAELAGKSGSKIPALTEVLDGIERMAVAHKKYAAVIIDEFQQVIAEEGDRAERQIRAAVQRHHQVSYVFAGSQTRILMDMLATSARAFWHSGEQRFLGSIPRVDFRRFLTKGLESAGGQVSSEAVERILDLSQDVPYNVQQLASACWNEIRVREISEFSAAGVDEVLRALTTALHPVYMQQWLSLTAAQKETFRLITQVADPSTPPQLTALAKEGHLARSTVQRALSILENRHILRQEFRLEGVYWRVEDPFFMYWVKEVLAI